MGINKITISASIVLYNSDTTEIRRIINAFLSGTREGKLYLVDNSPLRSETFSQLNNERVVYIFNNNNIGFGAGHNVALRTIIDSSTYHMVINPDITFDPAIIDKMQTFMDNNPDIGHLMPKVLYPDGSLQYVCKLVPSPIDLFARRFLPGWLSKKSADKFQLKFTGYDKIMDVPYLSGCFMFLRVSVLKEAGLFDERFFMYPEDIDLTRRIHKVSRTVFFPEVTVIHEHGQGSYKDLNLLKIHLLNLVKYFNKWGWFLDKERKQINSQILNKLGYKK